MVINHSFLIMWCPWRMCPIPVVLFPFFWTSIPNVSYFLWYRTEVSTVVPNFICLWLITIIFLLKNTGQIKNLKFRPTTTSIWTCPWEIRYQHSICASFSNGSVTAEHGGLLSMHKCTPWIGINGHFFHLSLFNSYLHTLVNYQLTAAHRNSLVLLVAPTVPLSCWPLINCQMIHFHCNYQCHFPSLSCFYTFLPSSYLAGPSEWPFHLKKSALAVHFFARSWFDML